MILLLEWLLLLIRWVSKITEAAFQLWSVLFLAPRYRFYDNGRGGWYDNSFQTWRCCCQGKNEYLFNVCCWNICFLCLRLNGLNSQEVRSAPGTWSLWITWALLKHPGQSVCKCLCCITCVLGAQKHLFAKWQEKANSGPSLFLLMSGLGPLKSLPAQTVLWVCDLCALPQVHGGCVAHGIGCKFCQCLITVYISAWWDMNSHVLLLSISWINLGTENPKPTVTRINNGLANSNIILGRCCQESEAVEFLSYCFSSVPLSYVFLWLKREKERADLNSSF